MLFCLFVRELSLKEVNENTDYTLTFGVFECLHRFLFGCLRNNYFNICIN